VTVAVGQLAAAITMGVEVKPICDGRVGQRLGGKIHYFTQIDSTNAHARRLAERGAPEGVVVVADAQTQGRGRLGRRWISPPHTNLYLSVILRPQLSPVHAPQVTLMAAVALAETIESFVSVSPTIKWPNDILVQGKKLAGILTELSCGPDCVDFVILGIGVNINFPPDEMPSDIRGRATSILGVTQKKVNREGFLWRLIHDLDRCYGELEEFGFDTLAARWETYFGFRGRRVRVELLDQAVVGRAQGIDRDGALILEGDDGRIQRVLAGDVIPVGG
jgi:BirA family biotin operon repressor/biotin-[acetyl-CoA-carboxylase] ligase